MEEINNKINNKNKENYKMANNKKFENNGYIDPNDSVNGINNGNELEETDALFAVDFNKIVGNVVYLQEQKSDIAHKHDTSEITTGVLPVERGGTGVSDLDNFSMVGHTHTLSEVGGGRILFENSSPYLTYSAFTTDVKSDWCMAVVTRKGYTFGFTDNGIPSGAFAGTDNTRAIFFNVGNYPVSQLVQTSHNGSFWTAQAHSPNGYIAYTNGTAIGQDDGIPWEINVY